MGSTQDLDTRDAPSRSQDAFDRRVAGILRLLESLRNDWPEIRSLVDEATVCEAALAADEAASAADEAALAADEAALGTSTAWSSRRRIRLQTELDAVNARLWELTHRREDRRSLGWQVPSTH